MFKSTQHGLDADFLELFDYTMRSYKFKLRKNKFKGEPIEYITPKYKYNISYAHTVPVLTVEKR